MPRLTAVLVLAAAVLAGCSGGDVTPGGGNVTVTSGGTPGTGAATAPTGGQGMGELVVVAVYQPRCGGPDPTTPDPNCPSEAVAGVEVTATDAAGAVVAHATTDGEGRAVLDVPSGRYTLTAGDAAPPRLAPRPTQVTVGATPAPTVTLLYESSFQ